MSIRKVCAVTAVVASLSLSAGVATGGGSVAATRHAKSATLLQQARVGDPAPGFSLEAVVGTEPGKEFKTVSLGDYAGKWLIFFFYPADFTFVCPTEIKGFNDSLAKFRELDAEVLGVSTDSKYSHLAWIKSGALGELKYPLLADFTKDTARRYGVLDEKSGIALRGLFIIDPQGVVQYQVVHNTDVGRSVDETLRVLEALQSGALCPLGWKPGHKTIGAGK